MLSLLCSNETRAPIANPPNSTQLEGTPIPFSQVSLHPDLVRAVDLVWQSGEGQTDTETATHTQPAAATIHFASATPHAKCRPTP